MPELGMLFGLGRGLARFFCQSPLAAECSELLKKIRLGSGAVVED